MFASCGFGWMPAAENEAKAAFSKAMPALHSRAARTRIGA